MVREAQDKIMENLRVRCDQARTYAAFCTSVPNPSDAVKDDKLMDMAFDAWLQSGYKYVFPG